MLPSLTGDYTGNSAKTDTVLGAKFRGGRIARRVFSANCSHQFARELGASLALAASQLLRISPTRVSIPTGAIVRLNELRSSLSNLVPATVGVRGLIDVKEESFGRGGYALRHQRGPFSLIVPGVVDAIARRFVALNYTGLGAK